MVEEGGELMRLLLQAHYDIRASAVPVEDVVGSEGEVRTYTRKDSSRSLQTFFGFVAVLRTAFCKAGTPNLHPLDAHLNLPGRSASHFVQKRLCELAAQVSFDKAHELFLSLSGQSIGAQNPNIHYISHREDSQRAVAEIIASQTSPGSRSGSIHSRTGGTGREARGRPRHRDLPGQ